MNCILDRKLDQRNSICNYDNSPIVLKKYMKKHNLIDIWRQCHKNKTQFTWRRKITYRRLDFWCISNALYKNGDVISTDIRPSIFSDHQAISLKILNDEQTKGPGIWKINNSVLSDDTYATNVIKIIENTKINKHNLSPDLLWEYLKVKIKEFSCKYGVENKRKIKINKEKLLKEVNELTNNLDHGYDEETDRKLKSKINDLDEIYTIEALGAKIRSRTKWFEKGEKKQ